MRERIHYGRFFGTARAGDRLPSIREFAIAEGVNRKTVAAAYLRLQREGLVQIRARSGIYLSPDTSTNNIGPLERMRRNWLEQAYSGARSVGLDNNDILRIASAVGEVERSRIPVIASSQSEANALAAELHKRTGIHAQPLTAADVDADPPCVAESPIVVCTPWHVQDVARAAPAALLVAATASNEIPGILGGSADDLLLVIAPDETVADRVRKAIAYCNPTASSTTVVCAQDSLDSDTLRRFPFRRVLAWPGCDEGWEEHIPAGVQVVAAPHLASQETLEALQRAILEVALRKVGPLGPS